MGLRPTWVQIPLPAPQLNSHRIVEYVLSRKKQGFSELTLRSDSKILWFLASKCDLNNSETVLPHIARSTVPLFLGGVSSEIIGVLLTAFGLGLVVLPFLSGLKSKKLTTRQV